MLNLHEKAKNILMIAGVTQEFIDLENFSGSPRLMLYKKAVLENLQSKVLMVGNDEELIRICEPGSQDGEGGRFHRAKSNSF